MKHLIFHRSHEVWAIREEDVPKKKTCGGKGFCCDSGPCESLYPPPEYHAALETALSSKAVRVVPTKYVYLLANTAHKEQLLVLCPTEPPCERPIDIYMKDGELYPLPEGFEVKIETHCFEPCDCSERCEDWSKRTDVATIVPLKIETKFSDNETFTPAKSQPLPEESQEELWFLVKSKIQGDKGRHVAPSKTIEDLKSKFTIIRK